MPNGTALTGDKAALVLMVSPVGLTELGARFRLDRPFTACRVCGDVFQSEMCRVAITQADLLDATLQRRDWSFKHARKHRQREHDLLEASGAYMTPIAANKLAGYGIISLSDMALDNEMWHAGKEALRKPINDCEG